MLSSEHALDRGHDRWAAFRAWLLAPIAATLLTLAGCGGGSSAPAAAAPVTPPAATCGTAGSDCGTVYIGFTDADGDFLSYSVDVVSLTLTKASGAVVNALPVRQRVDFAQLVDMTELVTAATIPSGTYVRASMQLDYAGNEVNVEVNGAPAAATVVGKDGLPLGVVNFDIQLDNRNHVVVVPGRPAFLQLDFDLAASHTVDIGTTPATATAEPFLVATLQPVEEKELRVRGPLVAVDTAASNYVIDIRPFNHRDARLGSVTVATGNDTAFEIDGTEYVGAAGLTALALKDIGTPTIAFGTLVVADRRFTAERVLAGSSVPGPRFDVMVGNVTARNGDRLTVRGGTLIRRTATDAASFVRGDVTVMIGPETRVARQGGGGAGLPIQAISVGQRIHAFGEFNNTPAGLILNAEQGLVRMNVTHLLGAVVSANPGHLTLRLAGIDGRRAEIFDFAGTGPTFLADADPNAYEVVTGPLDLNRLLPGSAARVFGFVTPFGTAPPDFVGRTVVDYVDLMAVMGIGWGQNGTAAPFLSIGDTGIVIDNANPELGLRHHIAIGPRFIDIKTLASAVTLAPASSTGAGMFAIGEPHHAEMYSDFASFSAALATKLSGGARAFGLHAKGHYDPGSNTFRARGIAVALGRPAG